MIALALSLTVALQLPPGDVALGQAHLADVPARLAAAQVPIGRIRRCIDAGTGRSEWDRNLDVLHRRLADMSADAEELYGDVNLTPQPGIRAADTPAPSCTDNSVRADITEAGRALDEAQSLIDADAAPRARGLWIGNLRLCGDRILGIEPDGPRFEGDAPRLILHFSAAFAPRLQTLTEAFVNRRLSVVLDGATILRPTVMEPVSWSISLNVPEGASVDHLRRAVAAPC